MMNFKNKANSRYFLWLQAGLLFGSLEISGNALRGNFPVWFPTDLNLPVLSISINSFCYLGVCVVSGLFIGLVIELIRRVSRAPAALHQIAFNIVLLSGAVYLVYGLVSSGPAESSLYNGLPCGYHTSPAYRWMIGGIVALLLSLGLWIFPRSETPPGKFDFFLIGGVFALVAFNISDRVFDQAISRVLMAGVVIILSCLLLLMIKKIRRRSGEIIAIAAMIALALILYQGIYFSWPGGGYDRHLVMLILDAQPAERMNVYGFREDNTPILNDWSDRMIKFERAYSPANYTFASHVSIFTGRYLREHHLYNGTNEDRALYRNFDNIAQAVSRKSYYPILLTENPWLMPISRGFEEVISCPNAGKKEQYFLSEYRNSFLIEQIIGHITYLLEGYFKFSVLRIEDACLTRWLLQANRKGPYFICINWMYFHTRYCPDLPPDFVAAKAIPQDMYDRCILFADKRLKDWIDFFRRAGQLEGSLFLLTADHGEFLGEFGLYGHAKTLFEPVLHVPLLLFGPTVKEEDVAVDVPLVALKTAILRLLPVSPAAPWNTVGFVQGMVQHRGMVVEGSWDFEGPGNSIRWFLAVWDKSHKYVVDPMKYYEDVKGKGVVGLSPDDWEFSFDLEDDPDEENNLISRRPDIAEAAKKLIGQWEENIEPVKLPPPEPEEEGSYPPGLLDQLRALGYMR